MNTHTSVGGKAMHLARFTALQRCISILATPAVFCLTQSASAQVGVAALNGKVLRRLMQDGHAGPHCNVPSQRFSLRLARLLTTNNLLTPDSSTHWDVTGVH
jgi:hypothetical protein